MTTTWEYEIESLTLTDKFSDKKQAEEFDKFRNSLNDLGAKGWEFVAYQQVPRVGGQMGTPKGHSYLAFFKRPTGAI